MNLIWRFWDLAMQLQRDGQAIIPRRHKSTRRSPSGLFRQFGRSCCYQCRIVGRHMAAERALTR
jgi:hypothetical protein